MKLTLKGFLFTLFSFLCLIGGVTLCILWFNYCSTYFRFASKFYVGMVPLVIVLFVVAWFDVSTWE